jgi:N-acyl-phosphatidylethanolamine-hydrolysing phospholipase D
MRSTKLLIPAIGLALAGALFTAGCAHVNPYYDPARPHHTRNGFVNNYPPNPAFARPETGVVESWVSRIRNWTTPAPSREPLQPLQPVNADLGFIHSNTDTPSLTWIGHATFLLQTGSGINILTDPVFEDRASPVQFAGPKRHQPPGLAIVDLPHIDAILLSHSHYDHLSLASLRNLYAQKGGAPTLYAPLGVDRWLAENITDGDLTHIVRMDWWDKVTLKDMEIHLLPVQHWSARTPWDRSESLWGAFALRRPGFSFFFSGDLGYSKDIADIAARFNGFDLAAIGIGSYRPDWYRNSHVNPEEAIRIHKELRIKRSFGMHWGTFPTGEEPLDQPLEDLAIARTVHGLTENEFMVLRHGETHRVGK